MKLALLFLALTMPVVAQTTAPPSTTAPSTPPQAPASTPSRTPATPPQAPASTVVPKPLPAALEKPEDHNGPAFKNPKSTLPKVVGLPHVLYSLKYVDTKIGTGPLAEPHKFYTVNYTGWFTDGTKFDSSFDHTPKEPITFPYGAQRVIIGWDTGFEGMHVGGKRRLYVPYQLAYGLLGRPPKMAPKSNLIFDVELVSQSDKPPTPPPGSKPAGRPMPGPGGMSPGLPGAARPGAPSTPPSPSAPATPSAAAPAAPATAPAAPKTPPATTPAPPAKPPSQ